MTENTTPGLAWQRLGDSYIAADGLVEIVKHTAADGGGYSIAVDGEWLTTCSTLDAAQREAEATVAADWTAPQLAELHTAIAAAEWTGERTYCAEHEPGACYPGCPSAYAEPDAPAGSTPSCTCGRPLPLELLRDLDITKSHRCVCGAVSALIPIPAREPEPALEQAPPPRSMLTGSTIATFARWIADIEATDGGEILSVEMTPADDGSGRAQALVHTHACGLEQTYRVTTPAHGDRGWTVEVSVGDERWHELDHELDPR